MIFSWQNLFFLALLLSIVGFILFFIFRRQQNKAWLPILKILNEPSKRSKTIYFKNQPWWLVISLLLIILTLCFYFLNPYLEKLKPLDQKNKSTHIVVDMSPSMATFTSEKNLLQKLLVVWNEAKEVGPVWISTTHDEEIFQPSDERELKNIFSARKFHREGTLLGSHIQQLKKAWHDPTYLVVISDGEQSSWHDFQWENLSNTLVLIDNVIEKKQSNKNIYLAEGSKNEKIKIEIKRNFDDETSEGILKVFSQETEVQREPFKLEKSQRSTSITFDFKEKWIEKSDTPILKYEITAPNDANTIDSTFYFDVGPEKQKAIIFASNTSEKWLEDSFYHFQSVLEIMDLNLIHYENKNNLMKEKPHIVFMGGSKESQATYCHEDFSVHKNWVMKSDDEYKILLFPLLLQSNYQTLCYCLNKMIRNVTDDNRESEFCKDVNNRSQWVAILDSLGGAQLGGKLENIQSAFAYYWDLPKYHRKIVAMTVPPKPSLETGLDHGQFPVLIKVILNRLGLLSKEEKDDLNKKIVNVPEPESLLNILDDKKLPAKFIKSFSDEKNLADVIQQSKLSSGLKEKDMESWKWIFLGLLMLSFAFEVGGLLWKRK